MERIIKEKNHLAWKNAIRERCN